MTFFKAEDFSFKDDYTNLHAAIDANEKLQREAKVVYGQVALGEFMWNHTEEIGDTHRALLICIEEIERKPCEHVPFKKFEELGVNDTFIHKFMRCGIPLKATGWEPLNG